MGQTLVEKIFSKNPGKQVMAGDEALFEPDLACAYDYPGYIDSYEKQLKEELNIFQVKKPEKFVLFIDHFNPGGTSDFRSVHVKTRNFAREFGIRLYEDKGIGHQVLMEEGYVVPGMFVVHFDGHVTTLGALGACAMGIRSSMIEVFATQQVSMVVPATIRIEFTGKLQKGVTARDVFHTIVRRLGPAGCRSLAIEYGGEGLHSLNMDSRFVICNQTMFMGGVTAIMETDEIVDEFLKGRPHEHYTHIYPDKDAVYTNVVKVDLDQVEPVLVAPPSSANTVNLSDYEGLKVDVGYIGSCASGRISDFSMALEILEGKRIAEGFRLEAVPASVQIQKEIAENGMMGKLIDAGACVYYPSCDFCYGLIGQMTPGEVALSTGTLNIPGRMGCTAADIYTASPYTIAAAAVTGRITDPRKFL